MYLPTPPCEQYATPDQFFEQSLAGLNTEFFFLLDRFPYQG